MRSELWLVGLAMVSWALPMVAWGADRDPLQLVRDGKAACMIVAPARSRPGVVLATDSAVLLANYLQRMSGAPVKVIAESELGAEVRQGRVIAPPGRVDEGIVNFVLVGESELANKLGVSSEGLGAGGLLVKTTGNALVLLGPPETSDWRGTRYAVVSLLEDLGCRYLWPGESGQVIPQRKTIAVDPVERRYTPPIGQRHIRHQPDGPRFFDKGLAFLGVMTQEQWMERYYTALQFRAVRSTTAGGQTRVDWLPPNPNSLSWEDWQGLNGYALGILGGHAGYGLRGGWAQHSKTHPEWFALQPNGTRDMSKVGERWTLCVSNPQLVEYVANDVINRMREKAEPSISLAPNDGGSACECMCEECRKLDPPNAPMIKLRAADKSGAVGMIDYPSLTDRYVHYWNAVAERVAKVYPDLPLVIDAYGPYSTAPVREKLHPNLVVRYVPSDLEEWIGWQKAGAKRIFWRPNNLHSHYREATIHAVGFSRKIADTMRAMAANGMMATDIQGIYDNWAVQGLNYYVAARIMWNPSLTYDQVLDDYCRSGFGAAAKPVKAYFMKALTTTEDVYGLTGPAGVAKMYEALNPAGMAELKRYLDTAETLAAGDDAVLKRIAFLRVGLNWSAISTQAALFRWTAQQNKPYDRAQAKRVLDERWLMARDIAMNNVLAVNTTLVAGYDDTNWAALGWQKPDEKSLNETAADDDWMYEDQSQTGKGPVPSPTPAPAPATGPARLDFSSQVPDQPIVRLEGNSEINAGWVAFHEQLVKTAKAGNIDVFFVGDSMIQLWDGPGRAVWAEKFVPLKAANFGISGDRTQHVLWRLENGELDGVNPSVVVIEVGVNNIGWDGPEKTADGVKAVVNTVRAKAPGARVILMGLCPMGEKADDPMRGRIKAVNDLICKLGDSQVAYIDIGPKLLSEDGTLSKEIAPDGGHLSPKGYEIWADAILPAVKSMQAK